VEEGSRQGWVRCRAQDTPVTCVFRIGWEKGHRPDNTLFGCHPYATTATPPVSQLTTYAWPEQLHAFITHALWTVRPESLAAYTLGLDLGLRH
jgi:hypothetical protein